jgi:acetyl-CoA carboxylase carboxyl transferase subunit alpha
MAKTVLDFEKPIVELEAKLEEMRKFSDNLDIEKEIVKIEEKVKKLKESIIKI